MKFHHPLNACFRIKDLVLGLKSEFVFGYGVWFGENVFMPNTQITLNSAQGLLRSTCQLWSESGAD